MFSKPDDTAVYILPLQLVTLYFKVFKKTNRIQNVIQLVVCNHIIFFFYKSVLINLQRS